LRCDRLLGEHGVQKDAVARRIREQTAVEFNWIAQRLKMESAGYVSNLLRKV